MSFPEQPFGFVAGRWVLSIGDTPDDADRAPDYVPVETGKVVFTPQVTHRVAADGSGWAGIIKDRVLAGVGERGQLVDAEGHDHLALAAGIYSVSYDFGPGMSWPSHYIEVKPEHTADAPLWLPPIAPPPEGPRIENRVVTIPADGEDGQVLVWDGAGFSWGFPPTGPKGDKGDPGTSDIVVDTTVGTRVFANGVMVHGDTGWRNISDLRVNGWKESIGNVYVRRVRDTVHVQVSGVNAATATDRTVLTLPTGFHPTRGFVPGVAEYYGASMVLSRVTTTGAVQVDYETVPAAARNAYFSYVTTQPWPTALPGLPG